MQFLTDLIPSVVSDKVVLAQCKVDENQYVEVLSADEKEEWNAFENESRRKEYLATRGLISRMILKIDPDAGNFVVQKDALGKPYGKYDGREYHISIAHTNHHVLCGISPDLPIGLDMEPSRRNVSERLRKRILHASEKGLLKEEPTIRIWTIKEALVKLQGQGMRTNLNECIIQSVDGDRFTATFDNEKRAQICSFQHGNNWLALAW